MAELPRRGHVVLWLLRYDRLEPPLVAALRQRLTAEECDRADRFHFEKDRTLYTAAHALLHATLGAFITPGYRFRRNSEGKPEIDAPDNRLRFNLTHTRGLAACAVTVIDDVGVDAEARNDATDCAGLSDACFAPAEAAYIRSRSGADRTRAFLRIWTLKEAFIKATGRGLTVPLADFAFTLEPFSFACATGEVATEWRFQSFDAGPDHQLAVALRRPDGGDMVVTRQSLLPEQLAFPGPMS